MRSADTLFDCTAPLFEIGEDDGVNGNLACRQPGACKLGSERGGDQLVSRHQGEIGREETEAGRDQVVVGTHGGRMGSIVAVSECDQGRRIDESDGCAWFVVRPGMRAGRKLSHGNWFQPL